MRKLQKNHVIGALAILTIAAVSFVAGRYSVQSIVGIAHNDSSTDEPSLWTVKEEKIGHSVAMEVSLTRSSLPAPEVNKEGVVTSCEAGTNTSVLEGQQLASINLSPVIAGQGMIPSFRDLEEGMSGKDVSQLRDFLCRQGYPVCAANSTFTPALTTAVRQWQEREDMEVTGIVKTGDIMWFSSLPVDVSPENTCTIGTNVEKNTRLFHLTSATAAMTLGMTDDQVTLFSPGNTVLFESGTVGILGDFTEVNKSSDDASQTAYAYVAPVLSGDGTQDFCALNTDLCNEIMGSSDKGSSIVKIESASEEEGIGVPVMAISINARGDTYVTSNNGTEIPVTVLNSDSSIALVDGIEAGTVIMVHGESGDH